MSHAPLRSRLPSIDPGRAALQTRLLAALDGAQTGDMTIAARADRADGVAIRFDTAAGTVELVPRLADGAVPQLVGDDGEPDAAGSLDALGRIESLVVAIERQLELSLRPTGIGLPTMDTWLRVDASAGGGTVRHAVLLGIAEGVAIAPAAVAFVPREALHRWRTAWRFETRGPALSVGRLARLAVGDVVLVGGRELTGTLVAGGRNRPARLRIDAMTLTIIDHEGTNIVTDQPEPLDPELRLPLTLTIDGGTATLGDLARLSPGSVLPLGIVGAAVPVSLSTGGEPIAAGELVAIGDAYGVLITNRGR